MNNASRNFLVVRLWWHIDRTSIHEIDELWHEMCLVAAPADVFEAMWLFHVYALCHTQDGRRTVIRSGNKRNVKIVKRETNHNAACRCSHRNEALRMLGNSVHISPRAVFHSITKYEQIALIEFDATICRRHQASHRPCERLRSQLIYCSIPIKLLWPVTYRTGQ